MDGKDTKKKDKIVPLHKYHDTPGMLRELAADVESGKIKSNVAVVFREEDAVIVGWYGPQNDKTAVAECHYQLSLAKDCLLDFG